MRTLTEAPLLVVGFSRFLHLVCGLRLLPVFAKKGCNLIHGYRLGLQVAQHAEA